MKKINLIIIILLIISLQFISAQWTSDSSLNTQISPFGMTPLVTSDGNGGVIVFFTDLLKTRAYVQKIDKNGYLKWNNGTPIRVGGYLKNQYPQAICSDGLGGAYLQYEETDKNILSDTGSILQFTNKVSSTGILLWNYAFGINLKHELLNPTLSMDYYDKIYYKIIPSGTEGYYYIWIDSANGSGSHNATLKLQKIKSDGSKVFGENGISVTKDIPSQSISDMIGDDQEGVFIATAHRIFQYDSTGKKQTPDSGVYIPRYIYFLEMNQKEKKLLCSSIDYIGMTMLSNYYLTLLDSFGNVKWERIILDSINLDIEKPKTIISENNNINLFWKEKISDSNYCINYLNVDKSGNIIFNSPKKIFIENVSIGDPLPFLSDSNSTILIWPRPGRYFYAVKIDSIGNLLWAKPLLINANKSFDEIHVIVQNVKNLILIWYELETRNGIYAQMLNSNGSLGTLTTIQKDFTKDNLLNKFQFVGIYPNPFNMSTQVVFELSHRGEVEISVYDILGRNITQHIEHYNSEGLYLYHFNANGLASGMYFCSIIFEGKCISKKMQFIK